MPFEISDDESAAIVRSIKAGSIIDSDKEIIQKFMDRVSSNDNSTPVSNEDNSTPVSNKENSESDSNKDDWYGMYPGDDYSSYNHSTRQWGGKKQRTSKRRNSKKRRSNKKR